MVHQVCPGMRTANTGSFLTAEKDQDEAEARACSDVLATTWLTRHLVADAPLVCGASRQKVERQRKAGIRRANSIMRSGEPSFTDAYGYLPPPHRHPVAR
jgi:hypothetical protein